MPPDMHLPAAAVPGAAGFDFFIGDWRVAHRRLKRRLAGDTNWETFGGTCSTRKILGGYGNLDDNVIDLPGGRYQAATLRLFDPATGQWSIRWIDARSPSIDPPMVGAFAKGKGLFFNDEMFEGRPIKVRFIWSGMTANSCHWEQAFSADGGESWETNWEMQFERV